MKWLGWIVGVSLFLAPGSTRAILPGPLSSHLPWERLTEAKAGVWVEYVLLSDKGDKGPWLRFLALGPGPSEGRWVEIWISQRPGSGSQAFRLLVKGDPGDPNALLKAYARLLGGSVQEIPVDELKWTDAPPGALHLRSTRYGPSLEEETAVQTEAGTFRSRSVVAGEGDQVVRAWFSVSIPLFGLVRLSLPSGLSLELHSMGEGGVPMIEPP